MTIDEAIKHCEEVVSGHERNCEIFIEDSELWQINKEWADKYHHIAEWLRELKAYRKAHEEICYQPQSWEYGQGIQTCIDIITDCLKEVYREVDADERI